VKQSGKKPDVGLEKVGKKAGKQRRRNEKKDAPANKSAPNRGKTPREEEGGGPMTHGKTSKKRAPFRIKKGPTVDGNSRRQPGNFLETRGSSSKQWGSKPVQ